MDEERFLALALKNPVNVAIIDELARLALPDAWLVAGCLTQTVWNVLTGRPLHHGISDYDLFYFDADTSWEAERWKALWPELTVIAAERDIRVSCGISTNRPAGGSGTPPTAS